MCGVLVAWSLATVVGCANAHPSSSSRDTARVTRAPGIASDAGTAGNAAVLDADIDASSASPTVPRAILVTLDGLGGRYLEEQLGKGELPGIAGLMQAGASTLNARADYDSTLTLPDHTSILTGRPVYRDPNLPLDVYHGWMTDQPVSADVTLHSGGNPALSYIASIFDVAHDRGMRTCMYAGKLKFMLFANSYNAKYGAPDMVGADNGHSKLDRVVILENNTEQLLATAETDIEGGVCDLAFIHIADLDTLGHSIEWGTAPWLAGLDIVDGWIGRLTRLAAASDAGALTGLVVTADHGGTTEEHGDAAGIWNYQVPFFAVGPGYAPGTDLYELSGSLRLDPGTERPRYSAPRQPVRNADAANVLMTMLGLPEVPGSFMRHLLPSPQPLD